MARAVLVIDGATVLDTDTQDWQQRQIEEFADLIKPGVQHQPWLRASLVIIADAALRDHPINITITTGVTDWMMRATIA